MERYCKLQLQKFRLEQADITHVCIAPNLYPLLQYLLLMDDDVVFNHTYYFINEVIPEKVCEELPCSCYEHYGKSFGQKLYRWYLKIRLRFFKYIDYPFLKTAELYAYDMPFLSLCIGNRSYSLLSDAPNWMTLNVQLNSPIFQGQQKKATSFWGKIQRLVLGDVFVNYWGNNKQCKAVYLTEKNVTPILDDKTVFIQSLE